MALKTVYLYPDPDALEWKNVSNPGAVHIDDGDASFATMIGSLVSQAYLAAPIFNVDIPAGVRIESVGIQIRMRGWAMALDVFSTAGNFFLTLNPAMEEWRVVGIETRQDPNNGTLWEPGHLIAPWAGIDLIHEGAVDISYIRLAVTYDDGEPEPTEPEEPPTLIPFTTGFGLEPTATGHDLEASTGHDMEPETTGNELVVYKDPNPEQHTFLLPLGSGGGMIV